MLPARPEPCRGPRAPAIRSTCPGDTNTTLMCSTPPPFPSFSQTQPPGRAILGPVAPRRAKPNLRPDADDCERRRKERTKRKPETGQEHARGPDSRAPEAEEREDDDRRIREDERPQEAAVPSGRLAPV